MAQREDHDRWSAQRTAGAHAEDEKWAMGVQVLGFDVVELAPGAQA